MVLALDMGAAANLPARQLARQHIGRGQLEQMARRDAAVGRILGLVARGGVGVAGRDLPAGAQLAADLGVKAAAGHLALRQKAAIARPFLVIARIARIRHRRARAHHVEKAECGIEPAIGQFALETGLIALALDRVQRIARRRPRLGQRLRLENRGIAQIRRPLVVQVIDHPAIRRELGRLGKAAARCQFPLARRIQRLIDLVEAVLGIARAHDHMQAVRRMQAQHAIAARLVLAPGVVAARDLAGRRRAPGAGVVDIDGLHARGIGGIAHVPEALHLLPVHAQQDLVRAPAQVEAAGQAGVQHGLPVLVQVVAAAVPVHAQAGCGVQRAVAEHRGAVIAGLAAGQVELALPARGKTVFQRAEQLAVVLAARGPGLGEAGVARQADIAAVAVARHVAAAIAARADLAAAHAHGQQGVWRQVRLDHAVELGSARVLDVHELVRVLVGQHGPAAHPAIEGQRPRGIHHGLVVVPAADGLLHHEARLGQRLLAHDVDDAARIAHAAQQARGAAHHLHAVVEVHALVDAVGVLGDVQRRAAVDLHAVDLEAARIEIGGVEIDLAGGDAGRGGQRVADVGHAAVVELLARDHRHRLRDLAERLVRLGGDAGHAAGVRARALGRAVDGPARAHPHFGQRLFDGGDGLHGQRALLHMALQAAAGQQIIQRLAQRQLAPYRRRLPLGGQRGREHQLQSGLPRELVQRAGQRLRRYVEAQRLCGRLGQRRLQRHGQAQAEHGMGQRMEGGAAGARRREKRMHGNRPWQ